MKAGQTVVWKAVCWAEPSVEEQVVHWAATKAGKRVCRKDHLKGVGSVARMGHGSADGLAEW